MGTELECCRRPQTQGKKDLKTYRGIQQKKIPNFKPSDIDEEDNFGTYNPAKSNFDKNSNEIGNPSGYLDSIYANKNDFSSGENFPKFSNFEIEPISEKVNLDNSPFNTIPVQENFSQPLDKGQYIDSYTIPQQNGFSQGQYADTLPSTTPYNQPQNQYNIDNYVKELPTKYISSDPVQYINSSSSNQYISSQPIKYNQNYETTQYIETKPVAYTQEFHNKNIQYSQPSNTQQAQYIISKPNQYLNPKEQSFSNFESNQTYFDSKNNPSYIEKYREPIIIEESKPNTYFQESNHQTTYIEEPRNPTTVKYLEPQIKTQYLPPKTEYIVNSTTQYEESSPHTEYLNIEEAPQDKYVKSKTSSTQYISRFSKDEQIQYIEPQRQIEYTILNKEESKPKQKLYIESQQQIQSEPKNSQKKKIQKKYVSKPNIKLDNNKERDKEKEKEKEREKETEKFKNLQPESQKIHFSHQEDEFPETQKGPDELDLSEAEPKPLNYKEKKEKIKEKISPKYFKDQKRQMKYIDSEEDKEVGSIYDEIKDEKIIWKKNNEKRDFSPDGYKKFYPEDDPFFRRPKGKKVYKIYDNEDNESNNAIYEGEMMNGKKHGLGKLTTKEFVREGTWKNDNFTGWGRESRPNGEILEGRFVNGKVEGKGILRDSQGSSYIGDFVGSKRDGYGELETTKARYKGEFRNNKFHGHGNVRIKEDESEIEGIFRNGEIEKENANVLCCGKPKVTSIVEKRKENVACQAPGFISNFFSKIFD